MNIKIAIYFSIILISGISIGFWIGQNTASQTAMTATCRPVVQGELDQFYTEVLKITDRQKEQLLQIENEYQASKTLYTQNMRAANLSLAEVIEQEGYESKKIKPLVVTIHGAMGELQNLSLTHLASIEAVLTSEQAKILKQKAVARLRQN